MISRLYFLGMFPNISLAYIQKAILVGQGLQHKSIDDLVLELNLPPTQILAMFNKSIKKFVKALYEISREDIVKSIEASELNAEDVTKSMKPLNESLDKELKKDESFINHKMLEQMNLSEYELKGTQQQWDESIKEKGNTGVISIKTKAPKVSVNINNDSSKRKHSKHGGSSKKFKK